MASQFIGILTTRFLDEMIDQLSQAADLDIENAKSETTKTVLELGYKKCLSEIYHRITEGTTLFVDRDYIHESEHGHIPYESDELTELTVHPDNNYSEPLTYASELPDEIYVKNIAYIKK